MSFLAPLFLLGALTVALPVVFHLVRRTTRRRTPFGSLMFLRAAPPRLRQRNRIEHLLLLLLRGAAIGLLALAFARPFLLSREEAAPTPAAGARTVVLVDTSASMGRGDLWRRATEKVLAILRAAKPGDEAAVLTFDREVRPLLDFEAWNGAEVRARVPLVRDRLAATQPTQAGTHLDQALIYAGEVLAEGTEPGTRELRIVLISDLQRGSRLNGLQGHEWLPGLQVEVQPLAAASPANAGLQAAGDAPAANDHPQERIRLRVTNTPEAAVEQFQVGWVGPADTVMVPPVDVHVPPGQSRILTLTITNLPSGNPRARLLGDAEPFDNEVYLLPPPQLRSTVLYVGGDAEDAGEEELFFLQRAFQATPRQAVEVVSFGSRDESSALDGQASSLLVLTGGPTANAQAIVRERLAAGATVLVAPRSAESASGLLQALELDSPPIEEIATPRHALLGEIDFRHPVFAPFADARYSDFTKIHFWKHRRVEVEGLAGARVLARFDDADPALVEIPVGQGRVLLLTSGWHPDDSQLGLSSKFVPLLYAILEYSGTRPPTPAQYTVGDRVPLAFSPGGTEARISVTRPDGELVWLPAGAVEFAGTVAVGVYEAARGDEKLSFAINLDARESETTPLLVEDLAGMGVPMARSAGELAVMAARQAQAHRADLENRQKLWRWLVLATLFILVLETWLAGRGSIPASSASETAA